LATGFEQPPAFGLEAAVEFGDESQRLRRSQACRA
jgi:hypothetical protein